MASVCKTVTNEQDPVFDCCLLTELYMTHWHNFKLDVLILMPGLLGKTAKETLGSQVMGSGKDISVGV